MAELERSQLAGAKRRTAATHPRAVLVRVRLRQDKYERVYLEGAYRGPGLV